MRRGTVQSIIQYIRELFQSRTPLEHRWQIGLITLKTKQLNNLKRFYTSLLDLSVLQQETNMVLLGNKKTLIPILKLVNDPATVTEENKVLAFLGFEVPSESLLGDFANHALLKGERVIATHEDGYEKAVYIEDPDKNKIKLFWSKKIEESSTQSFDYQEGTQMKIGLKQLLGIRRFEEFEAPKNFSIQQIHLQTNHLELDEQLFTAIFPFQSTFDLLHKRKNFKLSTEHYSFAVVETDSTISTKSTVMITMIAPSVKELEKVVTNLEKKKIDYHYQDNHSKLALYFKDHHQIMWHIVVRGLSDD